VLSFFSGKKMARFTVFFAVLAALLLPAAAHGQTAPGATATPDALFHRAAGHYIDGQAAQAGRLVERGLQQAPDHPRLRALREKLDEQQQQQQNGQNQQKNRQQQNQQQQKKQQNHQQRQNGQSQQQQQKKQDDQQRRRQQNDPQQGQQAGQQQQDEQPQQAQQAGRARQDELSEQQAQRILQAMRSQEKQLLREAQKRERRSEPVEKDW
jgi:hypothetical protein